MTNIFTLSPVFRYADAPAAIEWLVRAFGFTVRSDHRTPDGGVAHADLLFGTNSIGVSSATASAPESPWAHVRQGLYIRVTDPDAVHDRAVAAGAEIVSPLTDTSYGSRDFTLRDPGGHLWAFGTYDTGAAATETTIWPELQYADAPAAVSWLERALGFEATLQVPDDTGALMHARAPSRHDRRHAGTGIGRSCVGRHAPGHGSPRGRSGCALREPRKPPARRCFANRRPRRTAPASTPPAIWRGSCGG